MTKLCAIIVCDHGLGHLRRCVQIAHNELKNGFVPTLFAPVRLIERFRLSSVDIHEIQYCHLETNTRISTLASPQYMQEIPRWLHSLPSLDIFDKVISDNLPEILAVRDDAIISAQFFWHDVVDVLPSYKKLCSDLLSKYQPSILGCRYFAMPAVRAQPGFTDVSPYLSSSHLTAIRSNTNSPRDSLLITCGTTPSARPQFQNIVNYYALHGKQQFHTVFVDKELLPNHPPGWMVQADFTVEMFLRLRLAICRPGLGILTDLLTHGVAIRCVFEPGNAEMSHNADIISTIQANRDYSAWQ